MSAGKKIVEPILEAFESVGHHVTKVGGVAGRHRAKHDTDIAKRRQTDEAQAGHVPSDSGADGPSRPDTPGAGAAESSTGLVDDASRIERHLSRLDHSPANDAMLARLRSAAAEGRQLTEAEQNFMRHEFTEAELMDRGMSYPEAHELAGQTHPTFANYDPSVIKQFPELFNQNWRNYWGIE